MRCLIGLKTRKTLGPVPSSFKASGVEAAAEATGDEGLEGAELTYGVEGEGVEAGQILGFVGVVVVALILIIAIVFLWTGFTAQRVEEIVVSGSEYPELRETEITAAEQLTQYDVLSEEEGVYRIPIERSISIMANQPRRPLGQLLFGTGAASPRLSRIPHTAQNDAVYGIPHNDARALPRVCPSGSDVRAGAAAVEIGQNYLPPLRAQAWTNNSARW